MDKDESYTVHVDYNNTFMEHSLAADAADKVLIVNSNDCVDNKKINIREVDGEFEVETEPRVKPARRRESPKEGPCLFWRLWMFQDGGSATTATHHSPVWPWL